MNIFIANSFKNQFDRLFVDGLAARGNQVYLAGPTTVAHLGQEALARADVAVAMWANEAAVALSTAEPRPKRLVVYVRSYEALTPQLIQAIDWRLVDQLVFVGRHIYRYFVDKYPTLRHLPASILYNGVRLEDWDRAKVEGAHQRIGLLANLNHKKGLGLLVQVADMLKGSGMCIHVAGEWRDDRLEVYVRHMIEAQRLQEVLVFDGYVPHGDLPAWFSRVGWILSTSPWEGCPWNILEGMASGCAPLVHGWPGATDLFPGFTWNSLSTLAEMLCISNPSARESCAGVEGEIAYQLVADRFQWHDMVAGLESVCREVVERRRVCFTVPGDRSHASSRIRGYQVADALERELPGRPYGCNLAQPYAGPPLPRQDVQVISRAWGPSAASAIALWRRGGTWVVYDAADFYPEAVETINLCHALVVPTGVLAGQYQEAGVTAPTHVIPDMMDPMVPWPVCPEPDPRPVFFGTASTAPRLRLLPPALQGVALVAPGVAQEELPEGWELRRWKLDTIHQKLNGQAVAVLPQDPVADRHGSANKLLTCIVAGVPAVMADIPAYRDFAEAAGLACYIAQTPEDWARMVAELREPQARLQYLHDARLVAEMNFSPRVVAEMWDQVLRNGL